MLKVQIITVILCISIVATQACSCAPIPPPFMDSIEEEDIIFQAELMEEIELPLEEVRALYHKKQLAKWKLEERDLPPPPPPYFPFASLNKLKVERWFQNQLQTDTIYYLNYGGGSCSESVLNQVGKTLIFKTHLKDFSNWGLTSSELEDLMPELPNWTIVKGRDCVTALLKLEEGEVIGRITKSAVYDYLLEARKLPEDAHKEREQLRRKMLPNNKLQRMSYRKFCRLLRRKAFR